MRSPVRPTSRYDETSSDEDVGSESSTGLSSNQWAPFGRWPADRAPGRLFRGRAKSPVPGPRVRFVHIDPASRPRSAIRPSGEEAWGVLFDMQGRETERMEHILKKLGGYIRTHWPPHETQVITPEKMATFYGCYQLDNERLPFSDLFGPKTSNKKIAALYDHLGVDYTQPDGRHSTPGLTRQGFAQYMIKTIRAFPEEEYRRLSMVIQGTPFDIENTKGIHVRVPRSIPRHYLPKSGVESSQRLLYGAFKKATDRGSDKDKTHHHHHRPRHHLANSKKKKVAVVTPTAPSPPPPPPLLRRTPPTDYYSRGYAQYDTSPQTQTYAAGTYRYPEPTYGRYYGGQYDTTTNDRYYARGDDQYSGVRYAARPV